MGAVEFTAVTLLLSYLLSRRRHSTIKNTMHGCSSYNSSEAELQASGSHAGAQRLKQGVYIGRSMLPAERHLGVRVRLLSMSYTEQRLFRIRTWEAASPIVQLNGKQKQ